MVSWLLGDKIFTFLFANKGGLTHAEMDKVTSRSKFSDFLPYIAYNEETHTYWNTDDTIGVIWECSPVSFAGEKITSTLDGLFNMGVPEGTIMQLILYADDYIDPIVNAHMQTLERDLELLQKSKQAFCNFLLAGKAGSPNLGGTPLRNYRVFFTLKIPVGKYAKTKMTEIIKNTEELLRGSSLYPENMDNVMLIDFLTRFFNGRNPNSSYMDDVPIRKQVIFSESVVNISMDYMKVGKDFYKCLTPRSFPAMVDAVQTNRLFGGMGGMIDDADQFKTPYLYTLNIIFHDLKSSIRTKCNLALRQQGIGGWAPSLMRKKEEYMWAVDLIDKGINFARILPILWVKGKDENEMLEATARAKRLWEGEGYRMQEDKGILPMLFVSALPFGLYDVKKTIRNLDRDQIAPVSSISSIMPVQGDFSGGGKPILIFAGRKGQLCGFDIFDKHANNNNFYVSGTSGSGKTFFINNLAEKYYGANVKLRIIDIGGGYKKLSSQFGGKFIDFSPNSKIVLNPFGGIIPEEFDDELASLAAIIYRMALSATNKIPDDHAESAMTLVKAACRWAWGCEGTEADVDDIFEFLNKFPDHATDYDLGCAEDDKCAENLKVVSKTLAFNLSDFTTQGVWGKWFNGKGNFNISQDEFVVLELEHLRPQEELFRVVTLQVMNAVSRSLYLSDRSRKQIIFFDEAHQFADEGTVIGKVIENGYRLARKYGGSFGIGTQSVLDLKMFGRTGDVIKGNSAFKFFLESSDFERAKADKIISYDDFLMGLLNSLKNNTPKYSEIFMDTPFGVGVGRLIVDRWSYYISTSMPKEVYEIEKLVGSGMEYSEAIDEMVKKYHAN